MLLATESLEMRLIVTQPRVLILSLRRLAAALQSMRTLHSAALLAFVQMQFHCAPKQGHAVKETS
jgi:hypothetical protein